MTNGRKVTLDLERSVFLENELQLTNALSAITKMITPREKQSSAISPEGQVQPDVITFPYSRHSSYPELCDLVDVFKPRDVWPCTVDVPRWLREGLVLVRTDSANVLMSCQGSRSSAYSHSTVRGISSAMTVLCGSGLPTLDTMPLGTLGARSPSTPALRRASHQPPQTARHHPIAVRP